MSSRQAVPQKSISTPRQLSKRGLRHYDKRGKIYTSWATARLFILLNVSTTYTTVNCRTHTRYTLQRGNAHIFSTVHTRYAERATHRNSKPQRKKVDKAERWWNDMRRRMKILRNQIYTNNKPINHCVTMTATESNWTAEFPQLCRDFCADSHVLITEYERNDNN